MQFAETLLDDGIAGAFTLSLEDVSSRQAARLSSGADAESGNLYTRFYNARGGAENDGVAAYEPVHSLPGRADGKPASPVGASDASAAVDGRLSADAMPAAGDCSPLPHAALAYLALAVLALSLRRLLS